MAEIAVNLVIDKLGPLLAQEINLLRGVRNEIEDIKKDLEHIKCFLKDAEAKAAAQELQGNSTDGVQLWVSELREVAYRIEDVIDEFTFTVAQLPHGKGLVGVFHKINRSIKKLKLRRNIANDIQDIKSSLDKIDNRKKRYGLNFVEEGSSSERPHSDHIGSYFTEPDQVVGQESTRKDLYDFLVNETPQLRAYVLVGAGGLGKTTLVASAYKNNDVQSHFNCCAWINVGKTYLKKDLLRRLILDVYKSMKQNAPRNIETKEEFELINILREYLKEKTCMVVFDDVWKDEFWKDVEHVFPDNKKSSRLIFTTRNRGVAHLMPDSVAHISVLKGLPLDKAWQLFSKKAFNSDVGFCPPELETISYQILEKCGGLPLAIVAMGGLLSKKNKIATEWQKLLNNLDSELGSDPYLESCNRVLSEGYNDLPHHIKPCFLYFGLFPESYSICRARLIRLWIAEGFVQLPCNTSKEPEEIGEGYLVELIHRGLVQVSFTDTLGNAREFRVHDLMHEIILKKAQQLGFGRVLNKHYMSQSGKARRLTIHQSTENCLERFNDSKVRSIFIFDIYELPGSFMSTLFVPNFKLMKVLDFEDAPINCLPEEVGSLFHLHYLSLKNTKVKILPKSIGKLINLETLDLKQTLVSELPVEIKNLKKLRYLLVYRSGIPFYTYEGGTIIREGVESLTDLQKLGYVQVNSKVVKELRKLRQLKKLGICLVNGYGKDLCSAIANMKDLISLHIEMAQGEEIIDIQSMASPPKHLKHLYLFGNLRTLPDWIPNLQNLVRMIFARSHLTDDPMRVLHALPNLRWLILVDAYDGERLHIKEGWFPRLQFLALSNLKGLKFMEIENGAMPLLKELKYGPFPQFKELPIGIEHLRNLKFLGFWNMLEEIRSGLITYENWEKLKHIPKILVGTNEEGGGYKVQSLNDILDLQALEA